MEYDFKTEEDLMEFAKKIIGKPIGELDRNNRLGKGKGSIGQVVEESHFGYAINSDARPDFDTLGVELKVTPYTFEKKRYRSKERLVLNIINFMEEYKKTFKTSSFYEKNSKILMMFYRHDYERSKETYTIDYVLLYEFPIEDLIIIEQDWEKIVGKIKAGKAHEISEGDTLYLGACTKGANSRSMREQPFSPLSAMQRAFSLKQSYMTYTLNRMILEKHGHGSISESLIILNKASDYNRNSIVQNQVELVRNGLEGYINDRLRPFYGMSQIELANHYGLTTKAKNINEILLGRMLGVRGRIADSDEFLKSNLVPKTVRIQYNGQIKESMSFPTFKYTEIVEQEWEESFMYEYFSTTRFMFIVFREDRKGEYVFTNVFFWNMPVQDIEEYRILWERTRKIVRDGVEVRTVKGRRINNLPKSSDSRIGHVRPHARNAEDVYPLPGGGSLTKHCFWLNSSYVKRVLDELMDS